MDKSKYDYIGSFRNGLAKVKLNGKWGFINKEGKEAIPFQYDEVGRFEREFVEVKEGEIWYLIDTEGKKLRQIKTD